MKLYEPSQPSGRFVYSSSYYIHTYFVGERKKLEDGGKGRKDGKESEKEEIQRRRGIVEENVLDESGSESWLEMVGTHLVVKRKGKIDRHEICHIQFSIT